jgi:hypothetical protein
LTDAYPDAITTMDRRGRTPLHFALSNAGRKASPAAVRLLLSLNKTIVNSVGGGPLPLRVLAEFAATVKSDEDQKRKSCEACLKHLLGAQPNPTADFFMALQSLPDFLEERAVVMKVVQELLNDKIAQRFPTMILVLDFYFQIMVVVAYSLAVKESVDLRFEEEHVKPNPVVSWEFLMLLYFGAFYFLFRELIQILALISLKPLHIWAYEPSNWLNVVYIIVIFFWTIRMTTGNGDKDGFRTGAALCIIIIYAKLMIYLRNMSIDFAVFTGGVFHVMKRLAAFLLCLIIILVMFSRMFFTLFQGSDYCVTENPNLNHNETIEELQCEDNSGIHVWCNGWDSFLAVYTMLLGEVDDTKFDNNTLAVIIFAGYMLLVVILLANVLIAIVTESYKVIQDQRAAIVFWTNRLDFIAQMDAIANGPWKGRLRKVLGMRDADDSTAVVASFGKEFWKRLMDLFEDDIDESVFSFEFICYTFLRFCTLFYIIPAWVFVGILSAGWLWPPQIREFVFTSNVSRHNSESEKEDELRKTQVQNLKSEIGVLKEDLLQELAIDRTHVVQMKSLVAERKLEIQSEMKHIKRIVTMLFEQQGSM